MEQATSNQRYSLLQNLNMKLINLLYHFSLSKSNKRRDNMNNELMVFQNQKFGEVRSLMINDEPWFVSKDIASILGYKDTSGALKKHVLEEDKLSRHFDDSGQNRNMYIINESGLYSLILSSKLPNARKFKKWVTGEVLPSIRNK